MNTAALNLIAQRRSVGRYQANRTVSDDCLRELTRLATLAPSAFNLQNWKILVVRSAEAKARLRALAFGQPQVEEAAATFIICGTLSAYRGLQQTLQPAVDANILNTEIQQAWVQMATDSHQQDPQLQRDEAIRSASLAAMTLMHAAEAMGLATGAMGGFDAAGVAKAFELSQDELPVMLITLGYPAANTWPQKPRKPLEQVMSLY